MILSICHHTAVPQSSHSKLLRAKWPETSLSRSSQFEPRQMVLPVTKDRWSQSCRCSGMCPALIRVWYYNLPNLWLWVSLRANDWSFMGQWRLRLLPSVCGKRHGSDSVHAAALLTCDLRLPLGVEGVGHCVQSWPRALSGNAHPHPHPLELGKAVWEEASLRRVLQFLAMPCGGTDKCGLDHGLKHPVAAFCRKKKMSLFALLAWHSIC